MKLLELNIEDIDECHSTNIAWRMIKINTTGAIPKKAKNFNFVACFQHAPLHC